MQKMLNEERNKRYVRSNGNFYKNSWNWLKLTVNNFLSIERTCRPPTDGAVNLREMENLRIQLEEAERRLEANSNGSGTPLALQPLLRRTCEIEMAFLEKQRQEWVQKKYILKLRNLNENEKINKFFDKKYFFLGFFFRFFLVAFQHNLNLILRNSKKMR